MFADNSLIYWPMTLFQQLHRFTFHFMFHHDRMKWNQNRASGLKFLININIQYININNINNIQYITNIIILISDILFITSTRQINILNSILHSTVSQVIEKLLPRDATSFASTEIVQHIWKIKGSSHYIKWFVRCGIQSRQCQCHSALNTDEENYRL